MRATRRPYLLLVIVAFLAQMLAVQPAAAYLGQTEVSVSVTTSRAVVTCGSVVRLRATVIAIQSGQPIANARVVWKIRSSPSGRDNLNHNETRTDSDGKTSVQFRMSYTSGTRVVSATARLVRGNVTIKCVRERISVSVSPRTSECGSSVWLTAKVRWVPSQRPARFRTVRWSIVTSPSSHDRLYQTVSKTNFLGRTTVRFRTGSTPYYRVLVAKVDGLERSFTVKCVPDR